MAKAEHRGKKIWYGKLVDDTELNQIVERLYTYGKVMEAERRETYQTMVAEESKARKLVFREHNPSHEHAYKVNGNFVPEYVDVAPRSRKEIATTTNRLYIETVEKKIEGMQKAYMKYGLRRSARAVYGPKPPARKVHALAAAPARPQSAPSARPG
mmetsp:Transcript_32186/g.102520  ORF Transcript_32186/g.102520 Transcript_32186/m.102520 type:complete len:156 (-) Transcript_32186:236-703(-)